MTTHNFRRWWDAGFHDLVPIIPPDAPLSPASKIRPEDCGKSPGRVNGRGLWGGFDWRRHQTTELDLTRWAKAGAGIGLRAARFPGVDIDVLDEGLAAIIEDEARRVLGPAPARTGRAPKRLLAYRTATPFGKLLLRFKAPGDEREHKVELLADGQQYVVAGTHPDTGRRYTWDRAFKLDVMALTEIDRARAEAFFAKLGATLGRLGCTRLKGHRSNGNGRADRGAADQAALKGEVERVAAAVLLIPNDGDRDDYVAVGHAIKAACADDPARGFEIWAEWCGRWAGGVNEPEEVETRWAGFRPPFEIGADYLYERAAQHGFNAAGEDFEALEGARAEKARQRAQAAQYSDSALAWRFCQEHAADVKYLATVGRWLVWDSRHWREDVTELAFDLTVNVCNAASQRALKTIKGARGEAIATRVASGSVIGRVNRIARADRAVARDVDPWDADRLQLGTPKGGLP
jgi:hypothetical protein